MTKLSTQSPSSTHPHQECESSPSSSSSSSSSSSAWTMQEIRIPGCFVVLQGVAGDGMRNTMDSLPKLDRCALRREKAAISLPHNSNTRNNSSRSSIFPSKDLSSSSSLTTSTNSRSDALVLEEWQTAGRQVELDQRRDWLWSSNSGSTSVPPEDKVDWWMNSTQGCLHILDHIPYQYADQKKNGQVVFPQSQGLLYPGTTVEAIQLVTLRTDTYAKVEVRPTSGATPSPDPARSDPKRHHHGAKVNPAARPGWIQLLEITHPRPGFVVLSRQGYSYLAPGEPAAYLDPHRWIWRVTASAGAFVRQGLELSSKHIATLPYGSLVQVLGKTVNAKGLPRLQVRALNSRADDNDDRSGCLPPEELVEGWCSAESNPLSGKRGPILQPLPFPIPALYRVTWPEGAVIRRGLELSSPLVGTAPSGTLLRIAGRAFTEHPAHHCIERLQLVGNGGWISLRLNKKPPADECLVEWAGVDNSFVPHQAGQYHLQELRRVGSDQILAAALTAPPTTPDEEGRCVICLCEARTSTLVHGETGHIACCLTCARVLKARGEPCPVCRLSIDRVIQHFYV